MYFSAPYNNTYSSTFHFLTHAIRIVFMRALVLSATNVNCCWTRIIVFLNHMSRYCYFFRCTFFFLLCTIFPLCNRLCWIPFFLNPTIMRLKWCLFPLSYFTVFNPVAPFRFLASLSFIFIFTGTYTRTHTFEYTLQYQITRFSYIYDSTCALLPHECYHCNCVRALLHIALHSMFHVTVCLLSIVCIWLVSNDKHFCSTCNIATSKTDPQLQSTTHHLGTSHSVFRNMFGICSEHSDVVFTFWFFFCCINFPIKKKKLPSSVRHWYCGHEYIFDSLTRSNLLLSV